MKAIEQEQKARSSNFELLRIAAMLMIVGSHFAQHSAGGNWEIMLAPMRANTVVAFTSGSGL